MDEVLQPGTRIDRYGSDFGSFVSLEGTPYEMRAVAQEQTKDHIVYLRLLNQLI
ncbi:glycohydrolase toxin TNT-related protein [Eubacterium sp.]|uniref:glycohydrolase toxin TNT-related protein n=1 Tax=Eubacterium sp. TaxID=142586 RepID=UPI00351FED1C